jgi:CheY-like chemotaxis protein
MRVLCVDDDRIQALLLEQVCLDVAGLELRVAESGAEALLLVATWQPQLLVLDMHLPDTDGVSLLARLRAACGLPALPAVLCSAERLQDLWPVAKAAGFQQCWSKPVVLDDLQSALEQYAAAADLP